jgi:dolichol-phosphate mannosyltransferase
MREQMRSLPASFSVMGFDVGEVELRHLPRTEGKSSYTFTKLARLAGGTILAHSQMPLKIAAGLGLCISFVSIAAGLWFLIQALLWGTPVTGWASLIVAIFLVGGIQIFITGVVGIYVGKSFEEAKRRPLYFVKNTSNL